MTEIRDIDEELRCLILKHLDSVFCADCDCVTDLHNGILAIIETNLEDRVIVDKKTITLNLEFSFNKNDQIVLTVIK
jgi:hypothetical protein